MKDINFKAETAHVTFRLEFYKYTEDPSPFISTVKGYSNRTSLRPQDYVKDRETANHP